MIGSRGHWLALLAACRGGGTGSACPPDLADRGLSAIERGDLPRARALAARAAACGPGARAQALRGAIALEDGDRRGAVTALRAAERVAPEDPVVLVELADALVALGSTDEAAAVARRAAGLAGRDAARAHDARLLVAEALWAAERGEDAVAELETLPPAAGLAPREALRAGRLWLEAEGCGADGARAEPYLLRAANGAGSLPPGLRADAFYHLGALHDRAGRKGDRIAAWLKVWELEHGAPPRAAWAGTRADVEAIAREQAARLPPAERDALAAVPVRAVDYPAAEIVAEGFDPRSVGLYTGDPGGPGAIFLYRRNLEAICADLEDLRREVHRTLLHELGHMRGLSEEDLRAARLQ